MIKINFHSLIDLITNSSTEIFVHSEKSIDTCKELINEFLKTLDSEETCDDLFEISIECSAHSIQQIKDALKEHYYYKKHIKDIDTKIQNKIRELDVYQKNPCSSTKPYW